MLTHSKFFGLVALCLSALVLEGHPVFAQAMPGKTEWKLADGNVEKGRAKGFFFDSLVLSMQRNDVYVNGKEVEDVASMPIMKQLSVCYDIPIDDISKLKKFLKNQVSVPGVKGYSTKLSFISLECLANGQQKRIPIALLAPDEVDLLRPVYDQWMNEQARLAQERNDREMRLRLEALQTMAAIEQANAANSAANAARLSAESAKKTADEQKRAADSLEKIEKKIDK